MIWPIFALIWILLLCGSVSVAVVDDLVVVLCAFLLPRGAKIEILTTSTKRLTSISTTTAATLPPSTSLSPSSSSNRPAFATDSGDNDYAKLSAGVVHTHSNHLPDDPNGYRNTNNNNNDISKFNSEYKIDLLKSLCLLAICPVGTTFTHFCTPSWILRLV